MPVVVWCELCDLDRSTCVHGLRDQQLTRERHGVLLISPRGMAHFEGCPHKGEDPGFERWGRLTEQGLWQRLGNGERIATVDSSGRELIVVARCCDCIEHGPW